MEGSGHGLIYGIFPEFPWGFWGKLRKILE
jgi:hypothetical protein